MVNFRNSITFSKFIDQPTNMESHLTSPDPSANLRQTHQSHRNKKQPNSTNPLKIPPCHGSRAVAVDVLILIAVIVACGVLIFPSMKLFCHGIVEIGGVTLSVVKDELCDAPIVYASVGLGMLFATVAVWGISKCLSTKCSNPNCRGLREAAEFDIQLETEESLKNPSSSLVKDSGVNDLFELAQDHHRDLGAELRKMAPPNGRAIIVFRARCGCSVGRMVVPGPKKLRKIKK